MRKVLNATLQVLRAGISDLRSDPGVLLMAGTWLLPTLLLQLAFPWQLRTRLASSMWTVIAGSLAIIWVTQMAVPLTMTAHRARREGSRFAIGRGARVSLVTGSLSTLGFLAGGLPGIWLQARYAFAPVLATKASPRGRRKLRP